MYVILDHHFELLLFDEFEKIVQTGNSLENNKIIGKRIRTIRLNQNLILKALAEKIGISPSYLCQIEGGKINFSVSLAKKISNALGISILDLLDETTNDSYKLIRIEDQKCLYIGKTKKISHALIYDNRESMHVATLTLDMNIRTDKRKGSANSEEIVIVLKGTVTIHIEEDPPTVLQKGDILSFPSGVEISYANYLTEPAKILIISSPKKS